MNAFSALLVAALVPNYCDEPVKPAKPEYFKGDVADRFPPGHVLDNMASPGRRSETDTFLGLLELDGKRPANLSPEWNARLDRSDFRLGQGRESLSALTGIPLPRSEVKKLELLRKKLFAPSLKEGQSTDVAKAGEESKSTLSDVDDGSPRSLKEFDERVQKHIEDGLKQIELRKALRANQAANKSTGLDDFTLQRLERESRARVEKYLTITREHARENEELEQLKKD